jgi:hypothetical protein
MGFTCGIVGLPNVGKSTLFNALTATAAAQAANYPFCTIEPNVGKVAVPDDRQDKLASLAKSLRTLPTQLEFVDIAGLVRGAAEGAGLGNKFLSHIREVDAICHVLRCFENGDVTHVEGGVDPVRDAEIVETELMLADLESLEKRLPALEKRAKGGDDIAKAQLPLAQQAIALLNAGKPARQAKIAPEDLDYWHQMQLITAKPVLYVCNLSESEAASGNTLSQQVIAMASAQGAPVVTIAAAIESEIAQLSSVEEQEMFLAEIGLQEPGLNRLVQSGYRLLGLQTFFTVGPKETRAWTIPIGSKAPQAAGVIHTDFERGFIAAETVSYDDYITCGGEAGAKAAGKWRTEGKEYVVQDGDILLFRFNV